MEDNKIFLRGLIVRAVIIVLLVIAVFSIQPIILGDSKPVTLKPSLPLTSEVAQAFTSSSLASLPVPGKDFQLQNVTYFHDKEWVVCNIKALSNKTTNGLIVMHRKQGIYVAALGPGTSFPTTATNNLPDDVGLYLVHLGATYEPVY